MAERIQLYVYVSEETSPYCNLAVEQLLLEGLQPGEVILYLWQNHDTIVIGKNQNAWRECLVEEFSAAGGSLARRLSGGGAVYHDMGNQNFTFLAKGPLYNVEKQTEVIRLAAAAFGINAERSGRNDILADGRKFSGNAFYQSGENRYHHGTILVNSDMGRLSQFLQPSKQKLAEKGVASVRSRVVNLCELARMLTPEGMGKSMVNAFGYVYGEAVQPLPENRLSKPHIEALQTHYASSEWRLGKKQQYTHSLFHRFPFGEVELQLEVQRGCIVQARLYTDALEATWAEGLSKQLKGCAASAEAVAAQIASHAPHNQDAKVLAAFLPAMWEKSR